MGLRTELQVPCTILQWEPLTVLHAIWLLLGNLILPFCLIFRPSFRCFTWHTCILGILGCLVMMFLINAFYAFASIAFMLLLLMLIQYLGPMSNWGYISQALIFHQVQKRKKSPSLSHETTVEWVFWSLRLLSPDFFYFFLYTQVRKYLLMLDVRKDHVKFWRPQVLLMVANPRSCTSLMTFINDLKKSGLFVLGHVKLGLLGKNPGRIFNLSPFFFFLFKWFKTSDWLNGRGGCFFRL